MSPLFADTAFFVAFLNRGDAYHDSAVKYMETYPDRIVTTMWVLAELGNFLSKGRSRRLFAPFVRKLQTERFVHIVPDTEQHFHPALVLYERRMDKHWSFTDCTSFAVMRREGLSDALTTDHHFEQAGFTILLK